MRLVLINRYYPPVPSITGDSAAELAAALQVRIPGLEVVVLTIESLYKTGVSEQAIVGKVDRSGPTYQGGGKLKRFLGNLVEGRKLINKALELQPDYIICMTDPPLLSYWACSILRKSRVPWIYWSMDLYPDAFSAAGLVRPSNPVFRHFYKTMCSNPPAYLLALGSAQASYILNRYEWNIPHFVLPCGIQNVPHRTLFPAWKKCDDKIYFLYAGNIGEAHDLRFLELFMRKLDPNRHCLVIAPYGAKKKLLLQMAASSQAVQIVESVKRDELFHADVHLVTLLPQWTHVCVPSKAVSAVMSGSTILFNGDPSSDIWKYFSKAGWFIPWAHDERQMEQFIVEFLSEIQLQDILLTRKQANKLVVDMYALRKTTFDKVAEIIRAC